MSYYMGEKNKLQQQADAWFDQTNDDQPFDAFGSTDKKIQTGIEIYTRIQRDIHQTKTFYLFMKVAAAVLLIVSLSIPLLRSKKEKPEWTVVTAGVGEFKKITLPDSSVIKLKSNSTIRFLSAFKDRDVNLEKGEVFFDVKKDAARPFTVYANEFRIKVLGTSFNVYAYKDFKVDVISGSIRVEQALPHGKIKVLAAELTKDECLDAAPHMIEKKKVDSLVINRPVKKSSRLTLQQIAKELGDKYNLFVQLNNPDNDTSIYDVTLENQSLEEILKVLSAQTGFNYTIINKQHLIINPKILHNMK